MGVLIVEVLDADICTSKYKRYYLASVIARKVELEAMAPTHCSFSVSGNSLEYLIGISPEIMAYGYHRGINECYSYPELGYRLPHLGDVIYQFLGIVRKAFDA